MTPYALVAVGCSLGGLQALKVLLGGLEHDFPLPVAIVQHRGSGPQADLALLLRRYCALPVAEAEDKETIVGGRVYLAPIGYHLLIEDGSFALSTDAPVWFARPSIEVFFESAADTYGRRVIAVVLTSSSPDGVEGLAAIKRRGGLVVVQDPATAESRVLPDAALARIAADRVLPLAEIASFLYLLCSTVR